MKRGALALLLAVLTALMLTACAGDSGSDKEYVQKKGYLVVGVTEVPPMDHQDGEGVWTGFDAELAGEFAKELGVEVSFRTISDWDAKHEDLKNKELDAVWNGMTLTEELPKQMAVSRPYCNNAQVLVLPAAVADQYGDEDSLRALGLVAMKGSTGAYALERLGLVYAQVDDQAEALKRVANGEADGCVIDMVMAESLVGPGRQYPLLTCGIRLGEEEFVVGFRQGSDLAEEFNAFWQAACADGRVDAAAERYGLTQSVIKF